MKKILTVILVLLAVSGCHKQEVIDEDYEVSIVSPSGAPSLAFYNEIDNNLFNTADAASIIPELKGQNGSDIIVIDTVNGIKALNAGANYKLAATITFGNFYIAATGNDEDGVMDENDYIVLFTQGATPDLVFHYIYGDSLDAGIHYVQAVADASACLIKGINISDENHTIDDQPYVDYVMIAQPALTAALSQNENASVYANIQELYSEKSNGLSMIQASVFVKDDFKFKKEYLEKLEDDINTLLEDPSLFVEATAKLGDSEIKDLFGVPNSKIANKVLSNNSIGLGYKNAYENKQAIDSFVKLFGMENTSEEIYLK